MNKNNLYRKVSACYLVPCLTFTACLLTQAVTALGQQDPSAGTPRIWLSEPRNVAVKHVRANSTSTKSGGPQTGAATALDLARAANDALAQSLSTGQGQPLSMTASDLDGDGVEDLIVGFATPNGGAIVLHRGNLDAFAPQSDASFQAIGRGEFPAPFLRQAQVFSVPVQPDFVAVGDFSGNGHRDLAVAAQGGNALYILAGDGQGGFSAPMAVQLNGGITALAAGRLGRGQVSSSLVAGIAKPGNAYGLVVLSPSEAGLGVSASYTLSGAVSQAHFGDFGAGSDVALLAGGEVIVLHAATLQLERLSLPVAPVVSMALGSFVYDRVGVLQFALLTADGSLQIAAHNEFDARPMSLNEIHALWQNKGRGFASNAGTHSSLPQNGWKIIESIPSAAPFTPGQPPVLFRTRISDRSADDVMVLNPWMGQLAVISHPDVVPGATTFLPAQVTTRPYQGAAVAALPVRTNVDGRPGVVALHSGQVAPAVMMPLPDPTFFVNRTDDPTPGAIASTCNNVSNADTSTSCSLREAVRKANATAGTDTIMIAAGTYTLSIARNAADHSTALTGALYIQDSVNVVGAGQASTIVQGGSTSTNGVDMVFAVNEDIDSITNASASFSNLTIKFGRNRGSVAGFDGDGGGMEFDTGTGGTANLTLTNVTFDSNATLDGNGGGLAAFNASSGLAAGGPGLVTVNNCIFTNNSVKEAIAPATGSGGGIMVFDLMRILINAGGTSITNNTATGSGAGMMIFSAGSGSRTSNVHGVTITGNVAEIDGGGLWTAANTVVDQGTVISNNQATGANGLGSGGGIRVNVASPDTVTLSKITVSNNTAKVSGGGIATGNGSGGGGTTMSFSRLAGNTVTAGTGANLGNDHTTVTATNNWWGTNNPSGTISNTVATTTFDPFIQLTHSASPNKIRINQSATLTADMSKDNHASAAALTGNVDVLNTLSTTFDTAILGTIPQAQPEALSNLAEATATFNAGGVGGTGHANVTIDGQTVTADIIILQPPSITKSFNPTTVATNAPSTITFGITNGNVVTIQSSFTDTLPAGLVVAATPNVVNGCGGTVTATAGSGTISFTNAALAIGSCTIQVNVSSATDGVFNNSVTIDSTDAGNGNTASASLTVINPPSIAKAFGAPSIPLNGTTSLTFTVSNTNTSSTLTGVAFTDTLPAGLVVATPPSLSSTCGGTTTAVAGSGSVSLSGSTLAAGASCTVSVNVQGTTASVKNNSVQVTSTNGGTGNTSNASVTVVGPPVIIKAFGAASIPLNGSTSLSFTIQNNNTTAGLSGVAFTDTLPAGLIVSTPNGLTGSCGGGTITATQGTNVVSLSGAALALSTSCTFSVNVTGAAAGQQNNTTGNVTSTEGGTGGTASASVNVVAPPSIAKVFTPNTIALNATTSLTFTITNPAANAVALTGVAFTDTLPTGLTVANATATVCGGTLTVTAPTGIALTGSTIAASSQCQFSVTVTGAASGQYTNTTGSVTSTNGGTGNTATANLTVATPPTIAKAFGAANIPLNGTTSLTFNITNPNTGLTLNGVAFTDNLPAGLVVATPNGLSNTCGGTSTAVAGSGSVSLAGGTIAATASCTVSVNVQGTTASVKNNSVQVTSTEGGTGNTSNAIVTVVGPPVIIKAFGAASIPLNGSTSLTFTIQNNNAGTALSGVGFSDTLPVGLVVSTPNGLTGSCGGGTITATAGTNVVSLSGASVAQSSSCTFSVNVTGTAAGLQNNTTGNVTSTQGGTGGTASASVNVVAPPSIAKVFNPNTIALNATTSLTFTITNPAANAVALTGVAFTDTLPTGLTVANATATVCGGTLTTTAPTGIALTGSTIAANSQCQFSVTVTGAASGQYTNTTGNVTSTNGGTGNTASANLSVANPPTITKAFGVATVPLNGTTTLSFTLNNPNASTTLTGVAFTDTLPAGLVVAAPNGLTGSCGGGTITATSGAGSVSLSGATLASSGSCNFSVNVTGTTAGAKINSVTASATQSGPGNTSNATVTVVGPPVIIKAFGAASIPLNGSTSLSFTIQNNNANSGLTGVGFSDTLPAGLVISSPNGLTGSCGGGTITATQATNVISLAGATVAQSSSCTFSVNVTGTAAGTQNNTTGNVTSTEGGTGGTASASLNVVAPPSIAKAFAPTAIAPGGTSTLTFTITNPAANAIALTGVAFTDALPSGILATVPAGLTNSCGGAFNVNTAAGISTATLTGGTIAAAASCNLSFNVTSGTPGSYTNTTGAVSSTNGGTGNAATANLSVATPPSIAKAFGAASLGLGGSTTLTFTITNANATVALAGVAFTDNLPAGLVVSTPNGLTGTCGASTVTAVAGSGSVALAGGTIATNANCTFAVNVTATAAGNQVNTTGAVTSTNAGAGNTATASINVLAPDFTIAKSHTGNFFQGQTGATYSLTVSNAGPGPSAGTVTVVDTLPGGLTATAIAGTGWNCTLGSLTCTRADALAAAASYPPITVTANVAAGAPTSVTNTATVSGGGELNVANDAASDNTTVTIPPDFTLTLAIPAITVRAGQTASYSITVTPQNNILPNPINFTASGLPGKTSFVFTPPSVTPSANPSTVGLTVSTTAGDPFLANNTEKNRAPLFAILLPLSGLVLSGFGFGGRLRKHRWLLGVLLVACAGFGLAGCAGGQKNFQNLGTPPGTYTVTITATSGTISHTAPVTLVVQP